jgi:hypothetical protein
VAARAGTARFSHVWRTGRIGAQPDPGAHPSGARAALRAGRTGGRPAKLTDDDIGAAKAMLANPDIGVTQIAHRLGVSPGDALSIYARRADREYPRV